MKKISVKNNAGLIVIYGIVLLFAVLCLFPLISVISISISDDRALNSFGYTLLPQKISFAAYKYIFKHPGQLLGGYRVSILVTLVGTLCALFMNSMTAFALSRKEFKFRRPVTFFIYFSTLFNGGMVATYIMINQWLHLKNTYVVLIIPLMMSVGNTLILRTYMQNVGDTIVESARIDGANEFYIYFKIMLPLCVPALATVGLFSVLNYWNDWWLCLLYIDKPNMYNLQYILQMIMSNIDFLNQQVFIGSGIAQGELPTESARMAMMLLATVPMLIVFLFCQKFFVRGLTMGSVKG